MHSMHVNYSYEVSILTLTFIESQPQNPEFSNNPENFQIRVNFLV